MEALPATVSTPPKETEESKAEKRQVLSLKSAGPRGSLTPYNLRPSETLKMKLSAESIKNACKGTPGWTRKSVRRKLNLGQGVADMRAESLEKENVEPEPTFEEFKSDVLDSSQLHDDEEAAQGQSQEEAFLSAREETFEGSEAGDEETLQGDEIELNLGKDLGFDDKETNDWNGDDSNVPTDCNNDDQVPADRNNDDQVPRDSHHEDRVPNDRENKDQVPSGHENQKPADCNNVDKSPEIPMPETPIMNETFIKTDDLPPKIEEVQPDNAQLNDKESSQLPQTVSSNISDTNNDLSVEPSKENKPRPKSKLPLAGKSVHFSVSRLSRTSVKPKPAWSSRKSVAVAIPRPTKSLMPRKSSLVSKKSAIPRVSKVADPLEKAADKNLKRLEHLLQPPNLKSYQRPTISSMAKARPSQLFPAPVVIPEPEKAPQTKRRLTVVGNNMTRKSERVPFRLY